MNDQYIWDFLFGKLKNAYGTAALMGNLYAESRLNPQALQNTYSKKLGLTGTEYTNAVDNETYTNFAEDKAGYGLAQWTYHSRKRNLLNYAKDKNTSIGDLNTQLNFLWDEIQTYGTVIQSLKTAKTIRDASDIVIERYERPANQSDAVKQARADFGQKFYDLYANHNTKKVQVTADNVNIRVGNGKQYSKLGQAQKGSIFEWVATSENDWHAIIYKKQVAWISGEFSDRR